jgi:hypothetical protein
MPAIDPRHRQKWVAPCDRELPEDERPVFHWRPLTAREFMDLRTNDKPVADVLVTVCTGWERVIASDGTDAEFSAAAIGDVLTPAEMRGFVDDVILASTLSADEKKGSGQQLPTDSGNSAGSAPTATE